MDKKLYKAHKKVGQKLIEIGKCDMINQTNHPKMKNHENR